MTSVLIETKGYDDFFPISATRYLWDITCGAFTPAERLLALAGGEMLFYSARSELCPPMMGRKVAAGGVLAQMAVNASWVVPGTFKWLEDTLYLDAQGHWLCLATRDLGMNEIEQLAQNDIVTLKEKYKTVVLEDAIFLSDVSAMVRLNLRALLSDAEILVRSGQYTELSPGVFAEEGARIFPHTAILTDNGPVFIGAESKIRPFSIIDGPCFIGRNSVIDSAKVREGTTVRNTCKIGGELEESIVESYTNKHHEGFVGHSYLGSWVNIGAIATTSDLKNNYGEVRLSIGGMPLNTGTNKFGSIIADYAKIGIGLMLNTGSVVGFGANLFNEYRPMPKYVLPFSWGLGARYEAGRFISDLRTVMSRRGVEMSAEEEAFLKALH